MTGALVGLIFGLGLTLAASAWVPREVVAARRPRWLSRLDDDLALLGVAGATPARLAAISAGLVLTGAAVVTLFTRVPAIGLAFGVLLGYLPSAWVRGRARRRRAALRELWPDVVDNLASAVRAGLALPEAIAQLGTRGPVPLRPAFRAFAEDYRATGRFSLCLDALKARLADPVGDRLVESLRIARDVGGSDLGRLLRTLSSFVREDARMRAELEAKQSWTVNAARLAVGAPWIVLAMLATRPESLRAYATATGALVLAIGTAISLVAYRLMTVLGRLPDEERVLR